MRYTIERPRASVDQRINDQRINDESAINDSRQSTNPGVWPFVLAAGIVGGWIALQVKAGLAVLAARLVLGL